MPTVTKTIGTATRDYSTMTAWEADLDNAGVYSSGDDAVGECYDDAAFDESVTIDGGGTVGLASVTLTVASTERHSGIAGTGARIVRSAASVLINCSVTNTTLSWLELDCNEQSGTNVGGSRANVGGNVHQHHLIAHSVRGSSTIFGIASNTNSPFQSTNTIHNNIVYDMSIGRFTCEGIALVRVDGVGESVYNNTVHNLAMTGGTTSGDICAGFRTRGSDDVFKNNLATDVTLSGTGTAACFDGGTTHSHNASSDATASGTGSLTNIVTADQYVSTTVGSENLHLKAGSDCIDAGTDLGTTPTGVNIDINGSNRNAFTATIWDIGAHQYAITASIGATGRDYSTITLWEADLDDTDKYGAGANAVGECYDDAAFDESVTINGGGTVGLASVTLTVAEGERHSGIAGTGARIVSGTAGTISDGGSIGASDNYEVSWLEIDHNSAGNSGQTTINVGDGSNKTVGIHHLLIHNYSKVSTSYTGIRLVGASTGTRSLHNNFLYDLHNTWTGGGTLRTINNDLRKAAIDNNTIHDLSVAATSTVCKGIVFDDTAGASIQNDLVTNVSGGGDPECFDNTAPTNATVSHNASSDETASGTGSLKNIVTSDQYVSTASGSEDLHLKLGSVCVGAGTDLSGTVDGVETDIDGQTRPFAGAWDIGADERVYRIIRLSGVRLGAGTRLTP